MTKLAQDLYFAARTLRQSPVFTAVALLTLALGIGANSAIFSLLDGVLLRPLPFPEPERLVLVWEDTAMFGMKDSPVALGNYTEWRARNRVFASMGALERSLFRLTGGGEAIAVQGSVVTSSAFPTLGVKPALGRLFREDEEQPGAAKVAILSDALWRRRFGGDPGVIGRSAEINDDKFEIVGVMPPGFRFPDADTDLWAPVGTAYPAREFTNKDRHNWMAMARLKPGTGMARANEDIRAIAAQLQREFPDTNDRVSAFAAPLREHFVGETRSVLLVLAGAVGFVLLIACANIANLLLSRASNRKREVAIRVAIGANRAQILRQLLTEDLLLSLSGGVCGLLVAIWGLHFLEKLVPSGMAAMSALHLDGRVLAFTLAVSLATGVLFGVAPAFQVLRVDLQQVLKQGGARHGTSHARGLQSTLVISEVALAFMLTLGAALMIQTLARLRGLDPGFRTSNILTLKTQLSRKNYADPIKRRAYYDEVLRRLTALPGVTSAGFTLGVPLVMKGWINGFMVEGRPVLGSGQFSNSNYRVVTPDYPRTMGIPLRAGRYLDRRDTSAAPPVALINEALARKIWPGESPLGKRFRFSDEEPWVTVAGVVGDIRQARLDAAPKPEMYLPVAQSQTPIMGLAIRTVGDPSKLVAAVRREIQAVDKGVPVTDVSTMDAVLDREVFQRRLQMLLFSIFAAVAVLLASLGIYGVLAYLVAQRTREIGIRMAMGARPADILAAVTRQGVGLSAAGIAIGTAGAFALGSVLSKLLFGVNATDPATFAGVAALLLAVASLASYIPARRAMRVDPIVTLREE